MAILTLTETITYAQLVDKITNSQLHKGAGYTISDFATVHWLAQQGEGYSYILDGVGDKVIHTGANEPLLVYATSANTLAPEAYSVLHPNDKIIYDWNPLNYPLLIPFYDENTSTSPIGFTGIITRREDTVKAIKTNFDFREITYRLWSIAQEEWEMGPYLQNAYVQLNNVIYKAVSDIADIAQVTTVTLTGSGTANITEAGGLTKLVTFGDDLADSAADFVTSWAIDYLAQGIVITSNGADIIFTANVTGTGFTNPVITNVSDDLAGTVVETTLNYAIGVDTSPDISSKWVPIIDITDNAYLSYSSGYFYLGITILDTEDFIDRTMFIDDSCSNIVFDECDNIPRMTYGSNCYNMAYGSGCNGMTYGSGCHTMTYGSDCSGMTYGSNCYNMAYASSCGNMTYGIGCGSMTYASSCYTMTYGSGCYTMTYGSDCGNMSYGSNCGSMTYASGCHTMTYGSDCSTMSYGSGCNGMTYGSGCHTMTYGSGCHTMTYANSCNSMTYGSSCYNMTYGSSCGSMTYASGCSTMTYGNVCYNISYASGCSGMTYGSDCYAMTYGSGCYGMTYASYCSNMTYGNICYNMTFPQFSARNDFKDNVNSVDFTLATQITDGTTVTHQFSGTSVYQTYIDSSSTPEIIITTNTIGIYIA